ncbi:hypothetical protein RNQ30_20485 [Escherichia coli]|nr:hypothetical protein [Escherichia coli]
MNAASHSKNLIDIIDSGCELEDISREGANKSLI